MVVIFVISEDHAQTRKLLGAHLRQQERSRCPVVEVRRHDHSGDEQPQRVDERMSLAALDFLVPVVPPVVTADFGGLHRLRVDKGCAGCRFACRCDSHLPSNRRQHQGQRAVITPLSKVFIHHTLGQRIMRENAH